jgi:hypothetical protein
MLLRRAFLALTLKMKTAPCGLQRVPSLTIPASRFFIFGGDLLAIEPL